MAEWIIILITLKRKMPDSSSLLNLLLCKNGICLCHRTLTEHQSSKHNLFWNHPISYRVICHSNNKTIFTEILIHLKYGTHRWRKVTTDFKTQKCVTWKECQFAIFYQKVIFKPKISFISENKYIQVLIDKYSSSCFIPSKSLPSHTEKNTKTL